MALKNRLHAVQRKVISVFAHGHLRQQTRPRQPLLDGYGRFRRCQHTTPFRAGILDANFLDDLQGGRNKFQPLADIFSDFLHGSLAVLALPLRFLQVKYHSPTL